MSEPERILICTPRLLPDDQHEEAADFAGRVNPQNRVHPLAHARGRLSRPRLAAMAGKFWTAGQTLTWCFVDGADPGTRQLMSQMYDWWAQYVNLTFRETADPSQAIFRWTRQPGGGYWSNIGTDCGMVPVGQPTGNLDSFTAVTPIAEWKRVAPHEIGHGLGFGHTQLLPEIVQRIDPAKALAFFGAPPNSWPPQVTRANVLTPYRPGEVTLANVQLTSVMMYGLPGSIMRDGVPIPGGSGITPEDGAVAAKIYPGKVPTAPPPKPGGPGTITVGVPVSGSIDFAREVDQYALEVTETALYTATTEPPMEIGLFRGNGTGKAIDHGYEVPPAARLKPGAYRVKVMHRFSKGTGPYTLTVSKVG